MRAWMRSIYFLLLWVKRCEMKHAAKYAGLSMIVACAIACVVCCIILLLSKDSPVTLDAPTRQICEQQASPHKKEDNSTGSPCRIWQGGVCMTSYYDAQGRCTLSSTGGLHTMLIVSSIVTFVASCLGILVYRVSSRPIV